MTLLATSVHLYELKELFYMVTGAEVFGFLLLLILFGGIGLAAEIIALPWFEPICYFIDFAFIILLIAALFCERMRDLLDDTFGGAVLGIIANIIYFAITIGVYVKFIFNLSGLPHLFASFVLFPVSLIILVLVYIIALLLSNKIFEKYLNYIILVPILIIALVLPMLVSCWVIGYTAAVPIITEANNIAYYSLESGYDYLYEATEGYARTGFKRNIPVVTEVRQGCILIPADNENNQQLNYYSNSYFLGTTHCISFLPVKTTSGDFGYIESSHCDLATYYYSPDSHDELFTDICNNVQSRYNLPKYMAVFCYRLYRTFDLDMICYCTE